MPSHYMYYCHVQDLSTTFQSFHISSPIFYVDLFAPFDRSSRDLPFYNQSKLDRYHFEKDVRQKMIKTCTLYALILNGSRNSHPYPLFYVDFLLHLIDLDEIYRFIINLNWTDIILRRMSDIK